MDYPRLVDLTMGAINAAAEDIYTKGFDMVSMNEEHTIPHFEYITKQFSQASRRIRKNIPSRPK